MTLKLTQFRFIGFVLMSVLVSANANATESLVDQISSNSGVSASTARPYDVRFIDEMSAHHHHGAMMAKVAVRKALHAELREMARMMVKVQEEEMSRLHALRARMFPRAPAHRDRSIEMDMQQLESANGGEFDLVFLDSMIPHHGGAIFLGNEVQRRGKLAQLRSMGSKIEKSQSIEVEKMRDWRDAWSN